MVVVVYCYLLLTVHQATYSVREGVLNQRSPSLIFTSTYSISVGLLPFLCLILSHFSSAGYLEKH